MDGLDLTAFYVPYEGDGRRNAPYAPRMMVKVLLYAYATGVFSSREIARKLECGLVADKVGLSYEAVRTIWRDGKDKWLYNYLHIDRGF